MRAVRDGENFVILQITPEEFHDLRMVFATYPGDLLEFIENNSTCRWAVENERSCHEIEAWTRDFSMQARRWDPPPAGLRGADEGLRGNPRPNPFLNHRDPLAPQPLPDLPEVEIEDDGHEEE